MAFKVASRVRGTSDEGFRMAFGTEEQCRAAPVRLRCPTRIRRWRLSERNSRNGSGGTWEGVQSPNWHTQASHTLSATSVLRPFNCFT